ncbi:hypothetical protein [Sorangium sp. So ce1000]
MAVDTSRGKRATRTFEERTLLPEFQVLSKEQRPHSRELAELVTR